MEEITFDKLISVVTKQPFLIWNNLDKESEIEDKLENNFKFEIPSFVDFEEVNNFSQVQAKAFGTIEKKFKEKIASSPKHYIITSKSREEKIAETNKAMNDKEVDVIINPLFEYKTDKVLILFSPTIYNKQKKKFSLLKISTSTKRMDLLRITYIYQLFEKIGIKIKDVSLYVLATKKYKKGEVDFYEAHYVNNTKAGRSNPEAKIELDYEAMQDAKVGEGVNKRGQKHEVDTIYKIIKKGYLYNHKLEDINLPILDHVITKILEAKNVKTLEPLSENDFNYYSDTSLAKEVRDRTTEYKGWNGNILPIDKIPIYTKEELLDKYRVFAEFLEGEVEIDNPEVVDQYISIEDSRVTWYDFEAFSVPVAPMDGMLPYQQVVSQVSIIRTESMEEIEKDNLIFDPLNYKLDFFKQIIDAVYDENTDYYVVYNQSYENTRLYEMAQLIYKDSKDSSYLSKVREIKDKTLDLEKLFRPSKTKLPPIVLPETKGRSSIKVIEKYINEFYPHLAKEAKVKEYKNLEVQNGMMAMDVANERALDVMGENEWEAKKEKLKEYCENDVRAMIMVFLLIKELLLK